MIVNQFPKQVPKPPDKVFLGALSDGVAGIRETLDLMVKLSRAGRKSWPVRQQAEEIVRYLPQKAWMREVEAVHRFVRDGIRYTMDIRGTETVATPEQTLSRRVGDCDDKALLVSALLESLGHPTRFVAVGKEVNNFCHVLTETQVAGKWVPLETTENVPVGWYPSGYPHRLVRHVPRG